jgi:lysophospholipase L1-like esterase
VQIFYLLIAVFFGVIAYIGYGVYDVLVRQRSRYEQYWEKRRREPVAENAIRLSALGDSTVQGIGASSPLNGTVGRIARLIEQETGCPVHINNVSVSGAKAYEVYEQQLAKVDVLSSDIIVVAVGANDANRKSDIDIFKQSIEGIVAKLPPEKTIMADVALIKNRRKYQQILDEARTNRGIRRANIPQAFKSNPPTRLLSARDFFHPNDYGYSYWFAAFEPEVKKLLRERHF